jgi:hypothetical protein
MESSRNAYRERVVMACTTVVAFKVKTKPGSEGSRKVSLMKAMVQRCQILLGWLLLVDARTSHKKES